MDILSKAKDVLDTALGNTPKANSSNKVDPGSSAPLGITTFGDFPKDFNAVGDEKLWTIKGDDWYKTYGHRFVIGISSNPKSAPAKNSQAFFTLPIPPQSISITPIFPSQVTATLGGVVEEVNKVKFWEIQMSGTMGLAIGRSKPQERDGLADVFRTRVATTGLLAGISSQLNETVSRVAGVANAITSVQKAVEDKDIGGIANGVTGALNNAILPPLPYQESAINQNSNGFTEIHELQKFFYMYHKIKENYPRKYYLYFQQLKTNQVWKVIIKNYSIKQSASNPYLYRYDISLTGWDCKSIGEEKREEFDRFGPNGDLKTVNTVGIQTFDKIATIGKAILKGNNV